ncbi:MAG: hypothetical protein ABW169_11020 [Sphingobium sp.]
MPLNLLPALARNWKLVGLGILAVLLALSTMNANRWQARAKAEKAAHETTKVRVKVAQDEAQRRAQAALDAVERRYSALAERTDTNAQATLAGAQRGADSFIAANRLRPQSPEGCRIGTTPAADDRRPADPAGAGALAELVAVPDADIRICTENTVKALAGHEMAHGLKQAGLAE